MGLPAGDVLRSASRVPRNSPNGGERIVEFVYITAPARSLIISSVDGAISAVGRERGWT